MRIKKTVNNLAICEGSPISLYPTVVIVITVIYKASTHDSSMDNLNPKTPAKSTRNNKVIAILSLLSTDYKVKGQKQSCVLYKPSL
jgi:hypothetical protein